jgi:putative transposase
MSKPSRTRASEIAAMQSRTFFVTTNTAHGRSLFQTDRMANLLIEVLRENMRAGHFTVHDFVVMPDHVHLMISVPAESTIEKAVQRIKGGFSFRARRELGFSGEIWQRGFSEVRIHDDGSFAQHRSYIENNPLKRGLVSTPEEYRFGSLYLKLKKRSEAEDRAAKQGLKPALQKRDADRHD